VNIYYILVYTIYSKIWEDLGIIGETDQRVLRREIGRR
jgi:hypothetical protein